MISEGKSSTNSKINNQYLSQSQRVLRSAGKSTTNSKASFQSVPSNASIKVAPNKSPFQKSVNKSRKSPMRKQVDEDKISEQEKQFQKIQNSTFKSTPHQKYNSSLYAQRIVKRQELLDSARSRSRQTRNQLNTPVQNDFRCEFDLPKFCDLRKTFHRPSYKNMPPKSSILTQTSHERPSSVCRWNTSGNLINEQGSTMLQSLAPSAKNDVDEFYEWFQESHDFKILTRDQIEKIKREQKFYEQQ